MSAYYKLVGRRAVPCSPDQWANSTKVVSVRRDNVRNSLVSTVFLGLNHRHGEGPPLIYETMVFGGKLDQEMARCSTWNQAEKQHYAMVQRVMEAGRATP